MFGIILYTHYLGSIFSLNELYFFSKVIHYQLILFVFFGMEHFQYSPQSYGLISQGLLTKPKAVTSNQRGKMRMRFFSLEFFKLKPHIIRFLFSLREHLCNTAEKVLYRLQYFTFHRNAFPLPSQNLVDFFNFSLGEIEPHETRKKGQPWKGKRKKKKKKLFIVPIKNSVT